MVATAYTIDEASDCINRYTPDLVFLDILLGDQCAFDLLDQYPQKAFETIFTTAHHQFAIDAIKAGAFDYLLKPINQRDLKQSISQLSLKQVQVSELQDRYELTKDYLEGRVERIALPDIEGFEIVNLADIVHIKAQGNYCDIHFADGRVKTITRKLKSFESFLSQSRFCRVHHSHVINLAQIKKYLKADGGKVIMSNGTEIFISKLYRERFFQGIDQIRKV